VRLLKALFERHIQAFVNELTEASIRGETDRLCRLDELQRERETLAAEFETLGAYGNSVKQPSQETQKAAAQPVAAAAVSGGGAVEKIKKKRKASDMAGGEQVAEEEDVCFTCRKPDPEYMSTDSDAVRAPPVAVCSLECEAEYLASKGLVADDGSAEDGEAVAAAAAAILLGGGDGDDDDWEDEELPPAKKARE
jgi:hypothetical protein